MNIIDRLEKENQRDRELNFRVGDTVEVYSKIKEGNKERIQRFTGVVIAKRGGGIAESFTVRRIVQGKGVEKTFTVHSPFLEDVKVTRLGKVRRAKLYYLRDRTGRATRPNELILSKDEIQRRKQKAARLAEIRAEKALKQEQEFEAALLRKQQSKAEVAGKADAAADVTEAVTEQEAPVVEESTPETSEE